VSSGGEGTLKNSQGRTRVVTAKIEQKEDMKREGEKIILREFA